MPLFGQGAVLGSTDSYMLGHTPVGQVIDRTGLFEALNVPFMMQNVGGNITRAFAAHMSAAMPRATLHQVTATNLWDEDVVTPTLEVTGGMVTVPEEPGLGLTLDRDALARFTTAALAPLPRALVRIQYSGMPTIYAHPPLTGLKDELGTGPSFLPGYGPGYNLPIDQDFWEDDDTTGFEDAWEKTAEGPVPLG
jgi:hypothetical protein